MSGPIVRKYGFPNFEKIFGDRGLQHGVDDETTPENAPPETTPAQDAPKAEKKGAKGKKESK